MKILVTGGAGFIGSNVVDGFIKEGFKVIVIDDLSTGFKENINPRAKFYKMSICSKDIEKVFKLEKPDFVSHHAAQIDVRRSIKEPLFDANINILGSLNIIENSVKFGVKKIIYASTGGAIYGEPKYRPVDEKYPINPISHYGVSKHCVEHYLYLYSQLHSIKYTILRYGNIYGRRQNPKTEAGVISIFITKMLKEERPVIFGKGTQTRDYCYIDDVVCANILSIKKGDNEIYNIGCGIETSVLELYDELSKILGFKKKPIFEKERPGEINRISLDSKKAKKELSWFPKFDIKEGLRETIKFYKNGL